MPGADCYSDHVPVASTFRLKLKKKRTAPSNIKLNFSILKTDPSVQSKYHIAVKNKFEALSDVEEIEEQWDRLISSITEAAAAELPRVEKKAKQKWMTDDILELMDKRRKTKNNKDEYKKAAQRKKEKM